MAVTPKTIYLEIDEEVTSVIDKIRKTEFTDIVLVVPKDASISQSVVNLKLIKRKADDLNKNLSIVTQDKVARNLAGKIGIASAATAAAVPRVVTADKVQEETAGPLEDTSEVIFDKEPVLHEPEELTVVEGEDVMAEVATHEDVAQKVADKDKNLMPKFPWKWVALIGTLVVGGLLLAGYIYLPRAKATIFVAAEKKPVSLNFTGEKDAKLDTEKVIIPTQVVESTKEQSKTYPATGKKDAGTKATGVVRVSNLSGSTITIATFVPKGRSDLVYIANAPATIADGKIVDVNVTAQNAGETYNGFSNVDFAPAKGEISGMSLRSSTDGMTGGTTKTVSIVSQGDVNSAKDALAKETSDAVTAEFNSKSSELKIVDETKKTEIVSSSASPAANAEATEFTMTVKVTTKALAYSINDVSAVITAEVNRQLGSTMTIIDDGSKSAEISIDSADINTGKMSGTIKTNAYVSAKMDEAAIKVQLSGLSDAKATNYLAGLDGVKGSKLEYWPPFIRSFPRIKDHIFLTISVDDSSRN
jgi:hypothetical protein